ncbi:M23 family metallopeptidase [Thermosipho ferrireducens]|uniref:M23 family metallopeptidase n=1 Tax=Thermosipho ferrireducens TaxID=2571116 RepID=A0ABX7SAA2_9BACT|nr:M23 family metallopeptidase [Thermosipho ferrireducens]QTA38830.1 M23 family metallopeptidase [Thermosipho ferrireducens]
MKIKMFNKNIFEKLWWLGVLGLFGTFYEKLKIFEFFYLFFLLLGIPLIFDFFKNPVFFNFHLLYQISLHTIGQLLVSLRYMFRFQKPENYKQSTEFSLPFKGFWFVENGGVTKDTSHSWEVINQRYAYDFVIKDNHGKTYRNNGKKLEDYYAYEKPIMAPADGVIVQIRDDVPDSAKIGKIDWKSKDFRGNFVIIQHSKNEYSFLAHLKQGSVKVKVGDKVKRGQIIGLCGNSGHSTEPHLHFHVQDRPNFFFSMGLPIRFTNFISKTLNMEDKKFIKSGYINKGMQVKNLE